jgi:hypothetical protein
MSRARPENMFQHPQETALAPMRDKLLFIEAIAADPDVCRRSLDLRVGILLAGRYSPTTGDAHPSLQFIAEALGADKRHVHRSIKRLVERGWFFLAPGGYKHGGRGHVNRYRPNPEKVPSAAPFKTAAVARVMERKREGCHGGSERVPRGPLNGAYHGDKDGLVNRDGSYTETTLASLAHHAGACCTHSIERQQDMAWLKNIERFIDAPRHRPYTASELQTLERWRDHCDELDETYDGHTGDGIGGYAGRLRDALTWEIEQDATEWEPETI